MSFIRSIELTVDEIRCFKITRKLFKQGSYQVFCKTQINRYCSISIYRAAGSSLKCIRKKPRSGLRRIREIFFGKDCINQVKLVIETAWTRQLSRFLQNKWECANHLKQQRRKHVKKLTKSSNTWKFHWEYTSIVSDIENCCLEERKYFKQIETIKLYKMHLVYWWSQYLISIHIKFLALFHFYI